MTTVAKQLAIVEDARRMRGALAAIIADPDCCAASKAIARDALGRGDGE